MINLPSDTFSPQKIASTIHYSTMSFFLSFVRSFGRSPVPRFRSFVRLAGSSIVQSYHTYVGITQLILLISALPNQPPPAPSPCPRPLTGHRWASCPPLTPPTQPGPHHRRRHRRPPPLHRTHPLLPLGHSPPVLPPPAPRLPPAHRSQPTLRRRRWRAVYLKKTCPGASAR